MAVPCALAGLVAQHTMIKIRRKIKFVVLWSPFLDTASPLVLELPSCLKSLILLQLVLSIMSHSHVVK